MWFRVVFQDRFEIVVKLDLEFSFRIYLYNVGAVLI